MYQSFYTNLKNIKHNIISNRIEGEIKDNINTQVIPECEAATEKAEQAAANIGNKRILVITEDQYTQLLNNEVIEIDGVQYTMDTNTIYFCTEE